MKRILLGIALFFALASAALAQSVVQKGWRQNTTDANGNYSVRLVNGVTAGNTIVAVFGSSFRGAIAPSLTVSDNAGDTYTPTLGSPIPSLAGPIWVYSSAGVAGGSTTISISGWPGRGVLFAMEISGSRVPDVFNSTVSDIRAASYSSGAITTNYASELLVAIAVIAQQWPPVTLSSPSGFTTQYADGSFYVGTEAVSSTGSYNATFNESFGITGATWSSSSGFATLTSGGPIPGGSSCTVGGIVPSGFDATVSTINSSSSTLNYNLAANPGTYVSGGTIMCALGGSVALVGLH